MPAPEQKKGSQPTEKRGAGAAIGFGTSFAAGMALFGLGGHWLDERYDREPLFTLLGLFLGLFYGGWELWKLTSASKQQSRNGKPEQSNTGDNHHDARQP